MFFIIIPKFIHFRFFSNYNVIYQIIFTVSLLQRLVILYEFLFYSFKREGTNIASDLLVVLLLGVELNGNTVQITLTVLGDSATTVGALF